MRVLAALVSSLYLPVGTDWYALRPAGSSLSIVGVAQIGAQCRQLLLDPRTLARRGGLDVCTRLRTVYGHSQWTTVLLGKTVLFRYEDASDTRPETIADGRSLWVYDVATTKGPLLLRISPKSDVELTVRMPPIYRPLLAADDDGLWLAPATNGGMQVPGPAPLLHVTPQGHVSIAHEGGRAALWLVAHAHTVWMEQIGDTADVTIWRYDGPSAKPRVIARPRGVVGIAAAYGDGAVWTVNGTRPCARDVVTRVDGSTGRGTRVASAPALDSCFGPEQSGIAFLHGALYFLDGPRLYRIALNGP